MAGLSKIESYLIDLGVSYQETGENTFFLDDASKGIPGIVVTVDEPIVIMRTKVMELPTKSNPELLETLLRLNASDITHGAYGIDKKDIVLMDTLEYATMDKGEFEAALDSIGLALARHYKVLGKFRVS